jgi:hypothetical protein
MNIDKVIASQVNLGYLIPCGADSYRVDREAMMWEMDRRSYGTELVEVSFAEYKRKLGELGIKVVN